MSQRTTVSAARIRRGLLAPLLLMSIGVTFLAVDLGYVDLHRLHELAHVTWPLLFVLGGIQIAYARRQPYLALATQIVAIAVVAVAIALVNPRVDVTPLGAHDVRHHFMPGTFVGMQP